ncbi:peptidoglycan-binding domain-containing protein [Terrarubrum flagellatum]|uniref:peptidoglycan-binding domain-containing protein n=1 Tax=Terrirubrum flagellatum TaxID=2895980 RepID=UPI0031453054
MIPEICAQGASSPLLLDMKAMVGLNAVNNRDDVKLVQTLLVAFNSSRGMASTRPLEIDGFIGPRTIEAITTYQKVSSLKADGLVGPRGETIHSLIGNLQSRGYAIPPCPGLGPAPDKMIAPFTGAQALSMRLNGVTGATRSGIGGSSFGAPFTPTTWKIGNSAMIDVGWKDKGLFVAHLDITNEDGGESFHVVIRGGLAMASQGSPLGFDISLPSDPSGGGRVVRGLGGVSISKASFFGVCGVSMFGFEAGVGYGFTLFQFGWAPAPPGMCNGFALTHGYQHGIPSIGVASGVGAATPM